MSGGADTAALLDAGAILPPGSHGGDEADELTARTYRHPVLGERRVVRLVPGTLGEAEDLALDYLGLEREAVAGGLGQVRRETLGFPAWALVNDPANGHHALALVKDIERLAGIAKSRAGAAKEGFDELGERLGRSVPHFLPTFYEQAARIYLRHENSSYAATFFTKAREAERVHSLRVDEARQRAVFLEFAFAGALTVKAVKEHVRDLSRRLDPVAAWAEFRRLAVERSAAGLAPYAGLPQDARRLIKAAGLDREAEECGLLADLLASPAVVRAPGSFWTAARPALVALARRDPSVRHRLLEIMPAGMEQRAEAYAQWLGLLAESGAEELLTAVEVAGDGGADGGDGGGAVDAADWLSRWAGHMKGGWRTTERSPATYRLVSRMAERLRRDGRPVEARRRGWHGRADVDLLDVCLAEGVPLADPGPGTRVDLHTWFEDGAEGRRDLAAVAADPRFAGLLSRAVGELGTDWRGHGRHLPSVAAHPVLRGVLHDWLDERAEAYHTAAGLPAAMAVVKGLHPFRAQALEVNPAAVARIAEHGTAALLARTLRAGIVDELGWPALEEAMELLGGPAGQDSWLEVHEAWPALIVARRHKAVVVGPEGVLLDHDLRIPDRLDEWNRPGFRFVDGELLVCWWHDGKQRAYWSGEPSRVFATAGQRVGHWHPGLSRVSLPLPGGGRASGGRPLHAGDTALPSADPVIGDGTGHWVLRYRSGGSSWVEYDAATGATGRASLPRHLAAAVSPDGKLLPEHCQLLPVQPGLESSPLGTDGALLGHWVRDDGETLTAGTTDGTTVRLPAQSGPGHRTVPLGALRLPGGAAPVLAARWRELVLCEDGSHPDTGALAVVDGGTAGGFYAAGTPLVPPAPFWHAMRHRDEQGSAVLRAFPEEQAERLVAGVAEVLERERSAGSEDFAGALDAAAPGLLPEIGSARLRTGVIGLAGQTLRLRRSVERLVTPPGGAGGADTRGTAMFEDYRPADGDDLAVQGAVRGITWFPGHGFGSTGWSILRQIRAVNHVLSGKPAEGLPLPCEHGAAVLGDGWTSDDATIPDGGVDWTSALDRLAALAYRAAAPFTAEDDRAALLLLLEAVAEGPLCAPEGAVRRVVLEEKQGKEEKPRKAGEDVRCERGGQVLRHGGRTVVVLARQSVDQDAGTVRWLALDHDPAARFGPVAHFTRHEETPRTGSVVAGRLTELIRLTRERGPALYRPEAAAALSGATNAGTAEAAMLVSGMPRGGPGPWSFPPGVLESTGLTARQAAMGIGRLHALDDVDRILALSALLPRRPADLWARGPDSEAGVTEWTRRFGSLVRVSEELTAELPGVPVGTATELFNPERAPWLSGSTVQRLGEFGLEADDGDAVPESRDITDAVAALAGLAYGLPYGHPLRAALPGGLAALRRRLQDPALLLDLDIEWAAAHGALPAAVVRRAYGLPAAGGAGADGLVRAGEAFVLCPSYGDTEETVLRPARLTGADDPAFGLLESVLAGSAWEAVQALRAVLGDELERAVAAGSEGTAFDGYAQDPARSVPELVAEVAAAHELSTDVAALYLQLLALPDPTDRNRARWTGFGPARLKKARAELAATGLVVAAKRARAGRGLFLPGGWEALKSPALPIETWKRGLYPVPDDAPAVPLLPVPELFARAWQRVRDGDAPAYEELTTRATRKGRRR